MRIEGKTKIIEPLFGIPEIGLVTTKDDLTAHDGEKRDVMVGKAELATRTTCNVCELLRNHDLRVAYIGRDGPTTFLTEIHKMIPVEVVVRQYAVGSYCERHPDVERRSRLSPPVLEFFYKTTGKRIGDFKLPCDDPLMVVDWPQDANDPTIMLYNPHLPLTQPIGEFPYKGLDRDERYHLRILLHDAGPLALRVFHVLSEAWMSVGGCIVDFKIEFGICRGEDGDDMELVICDVIDCDSWRVYWNDIQLSKQPYRDGDNLEKVLAIYRLAASLTDRFVR